MKKSLIILIVLTISGYGLSACNNSENKNAGMEVTRESETGKHKKGKKEKEENKHGTKLEILQRWEMPDVLTEISDIQNIDDHSFACVQDESGIIFIYNLDAKKIERQIPFAGKGDYEGITLVGNTAYVLSSSGTVYEVSDIRNSKPTVKLYKTFLSKKDDVEAVCYDKQHNRLLVSFKAEEGNGRVKGVYAFDLKTKKLGEQPVYSINIEIESATDKKKKKQAFRPSAMAIHPVSGELYLLEGTHPKILVADQEGKMLSLLQLNTKEFVQPEGITFNSEGEMFISNEGQGGNGNILKVRF